MRFLLLVVPLALYAGSVTTGQYGNYRTRANTSEAVLTQSNVVAGKFGRLGNFAMASAMEAQPLVVETVVGSATHVLLACTVTNICYAYDADLPSSSALWSTNLGAPKLGLNGMAEYGGSPGSLGCLSTPVVDTATNVMYASCLFNVGGWQLVSLNIADGSAFHAPVSVAATFGSCPAFSAYAQIQRPALTLANGNIYLAFGEPDFTGSPASEGWIIGYDKTTFSQIGAWCSVADGSWGSFWGSGQGLAVDDSGNLYGQTGDGTYDGVNNWGDSSLKFSPTLSRLSSATPSNYAALQSGDLDLGSSGNVIVGSFVMGGGKDAFWRVMNQSNLGGLEGTDVGPVQKFSVGRAVFAGFVMAPDALFIVNSGIHVARYAWDGSTFTTTPSCANTLGLGYFAPDLAYSSNGSTAGSKIVWQSSRGLQNIYAMNADTCAQLWGSATSAADSPGGSIAKLSTLTIVNGKVYLATWNSGVVVYGLLPSSQTRGAASKRGATTQR